MAISSAISFKRISDSVSATKDAAKETTKTTIKISNFLGQNIISKRGIFSDIKSLKSKRIQREKRKVLLDRMSAPILAVRARGPRALSLSDSGTSIVNRLLGFVGYLTAGWALANLPTWIGLGEQFITRISTAGSILGTYGDELMSVMTNIGNVFMAAVSNISRFDFTDSSYLVRSSLEDLKITIDTLGEGISRAFQVLIQPFKALEKIPDAYNQLPSILPGFEEQEPQQPTQPGSYPKGTYDAKKLTQLARSVGMPENKIPTMVAIALAESGGKTDSLNDNPKTGDLSYGLWQINMIGALGPDRRKRYGLKSNEELKDPATNARVAKEILLKDGGLNAWSTYDSGRGRYKNFLSQAQKAYSEVKTQPVISVSSPANTLASLGSPAAFIENLFTGLFGGKTPPPIPAGKRKLAKGDIFTKSLGKGVDYIQVSSLVGDGRGHAGIDIAAPSGTYISLRVDCEVVATGRYGYYGLLIDVWVPSLGIQLRMAHLSSVIIKSGRIPAGTSFARVGTSGRVTGPHIHLEYDTKKGTRGGGALNDDPQNYEANLGQYVRLLYLTNTPIGRAFSGTTPLVPGAPLVSPQQASEVDMQSMSALETLLGGLSQERSGRKVVVIDDRKPSKTMMISSSNDNVLDDLSIDESTILNTFIKNKLLLDLSYV